MLEGAIVPPFAFDPIQGSQFLVRNPFLSIVLAHLLAYFVRCCLARLVAGRTIRSMLQAPSCTMLQAPSCTVQWFKSRGNQAPPPLEEHFLFPWSVLRQKVRACEANEVPP